MTQCGGGASGHTSITRIMVERTRVPATLEITIFAGSRELRELRRQRRHFLEQHMAGFEAIVARGAA